MEYEEIYLAIVTSIVGALGIIFTWLQFRLARKKRKDDLFNLRYEFYSYISSMWLDTYYDRENNTLNIVDLIPLAEKAEFLFGKKLSKHIYSLEDKRASNGMIPDKEFTEPFRKYLTLS